MIGLLWTKKKTWENVCYTVCTRVQKSLAFHGSDVMWLNASCAAVSSFHILVELDYFHVNGLKSVRLTINSMISCVKIYIISFVHVCSWLTHNWYGVSSRYMINDILIKKILHLTTNLSLIFTKWLYLLTHNDIILFCFELCVFANVTIRLYWMLIALNLHICNSDL